MATKIINSVYHTSPTIVSSEDAIGPITVQPTFWAATTPAELESLGLSAEDVRKASEGKATCVVNSDGNVYAIVGTGYASSTMYNISLMSETNIYSFFVSNDTLTVTTKQLSYQ